MTERPPDREKERRPHRTRRDWERISAIAGVVGVAVAVVAVFAPMAWDALHPSDNRKMFDGPIARIAIQEKGWDMRGFDKSELDTLANLVTYRYAGHYSDINGDWNPANKMCELTLRANASADFPYGGDSGFVYVQPGTSKKAEGTILHNPTLDEVYRTRLKYEYVPPECYPGPEGKTQYEHGFEELLAPIRG